MISAGSITPSIRVIHTARRPASGRGKTCDDETGTAISASRLRNLSLSLHAVAATAEWSHTMERISDLTDGEQYTHPPS
jgi:hypothetical protein